MSDAPGRTRTCDLRFRSPSEVGKGWQPIVIYKDTGVGGSVLWEHEDLRSGRHVVEAGATTLVTERCHDRCQDGETVVPRRRMQQRAQRAFVRGALMVAALAMTAGVASAQPATADQLRQQLRKERNERALLRAELREARRAWRPAVESAVALAAATWGVDRGLLWDIARCESTWTPTATNGKYVGLFQFGPVLWGGQSYRYFPRTDPYAAALAAAKVISRGGLHHWDASRSCWGR